MSRPSVKTYLKQIETRDRAAYLARRELVIHCLPGLEHSLDPYECLIEHAGRFAGDNESLIREFREQLDLAKTFHESFGSGLMGTPDRAVSLIFQAAALLSALPEESIFTLVVQLNAREQARKARVRLEQMAMRFQIQGQSNQGQKH